MRVFLQVYELTVGRPLFRMVPVPSVGLNTARHIVYQILCATGEISSESQRSFPSTDNSSGHGESYLLSKFSATRIDHACSREIISHSASRISVHRSANQRGEQGARFGVVGHGRRGHCEPDTMLPPPRPCEEAHSRRVAHAALLRQRRLVHARTVQSRRGINDVAPA